MATTDQSNAALLGGMGSLGGSAVGGVLGNVAAQGQQTAAQQAQLNALGAYTGINLPSLQSMQVNPLLESIQGNINPALQGTQQIGSNALQGITTSPQLLQAQLGALSQLQQLGQGGLTAQERNVLMTVANQVGGAQAAANKAIMANMAARGMAGSGAELAAELSAGQGAANTAAQQGSNIAAQGQQNALAAMMNAGQLGGNIQQQQFGQQAAVGQAQNAINQFNTANRQNVAAQNAAAQNQAQYYNLQNAQQIANQNAAAQNQAQYYGSQLQQNQFNNQLAKATGVAQQNNNLGNYYGGQANATRGMYSGIGNALGSAAGDYAAYSSQNPSSSGSGNNSNGNSNNSSGSSVLQAGETLAPLAIAALA